MTNCECENSTCPCRGEGCSNDAAAGPTTQYGTRLCPACAKHMPTTFLLPGHEPKAHTDELQADLDALNDEMGAEARCRS
jgi:hypothetical protein